MNKKKYPAASNSCVGYRGTMEPYSGLCCGNRIANGEFSGAGFPIISELKKFPILTNAPPKATGIPILS